MVYTLTVKNTSGNTPINGYVFEENMSDVLQYADITDLHGGTKDDKNIVRWPAVDIAPNQSVSKDITVKVKAKIPQTSSAGTNPGSYDMIMTNVFGDTVNIKLKKSARKQVETTTTSLPNTGPGETLLVGFVITMAAGYFFARSRLMVKELEIVRDDYASGGTA